MKMKKRFSAVFAAILLLFILSLPAFAASDQPLLVDDADLLTDHEESVILATLNTVRKKQQADIVIVTVDSLDGKTATEYADDFYDEHGYGYGSEKDGALLLIGMDDQQWAISTCGFGITALTDAGVDYISDQFLPYLDDGNYAEAFNVYAEQCDELFTMARNGEPFDVEDVPKEPFNYGVHLIFALVIAFVVAFVIVSKMKGKLKTVRSQPAAGSYVKEGSMHVSEKKDAFLYKHVDRKEIPKDTNSSGGSTTHSSSSGVTHGGSSGSFGGGGFGGGGFGRK